MTIQADRAAILVLRGILSFQAARLLSLVFELRKEYRWREMLKDIDENGGAREMHDIDYRERFDEKWSEFTPEEQHAIDTEINRLLDALIANPGRNWGSIMNTSIEGGKRNPFTGEPGDWGGTPWQPIWEHHGRSDEQAGLFFGTLWKLRIIERPELWIGVRTTDENPTFPNRGINLAGKTYFLAKKQ